ncbi:MAG: phage terminase large subunit [Lentisphaeria bacterium]|nr:phage terminase large subunit [Lentisphaeria bacterium]
MGNFKYSPAQQEALSLLGSGARFCLLYGGSRSGKTFVLCCALVIRALKGAGSRHAVIRRHFNGVRSAVGNDTMPKALRCRFPGVEYEYSKTDSVFRFPNGSEIQLVGLDDAQRAEKILGREFATLYFNECSELDFGSVQTALTRLAQYVPGLSNKAFFDCNPPGKSHWSYRMFVQKLNPADNTPLVLPEQYAMMRINPADNKENLPPGYIDDTLGTLSVRQRRRFLEGQWQDEVEGALWNSEIIDRNRVVNPPELLRVVIGVDPAVTAGKNSDLTGIVGAGTSADGHYYILADRSCRVNPLEWGREVIKLYRELNADRVIGEVNNGGDLIRTMLCELSPGLPFQAVSARRGKVLRAEPVAALYEKNLVHHAGLFSDLEEEMCSYSPLTAVKSPDRLDALVWAVAALSEPREKRFILA